MATDSDYDFKKEYEDLRSHFRGMDAESIKNGSWFVSLVRKILENYVKKVDAEYIRRKYPGAGVTNQSKKAISLAAKYASLGGGASAAVITGLELSIPASGGLDALVSVPAIGAAILADVALSSTIQLRSTYDLSVIHGAPLSLDDAEDCMFIFAAALGVKLGETAGDVAKSVGPKVVAYNVRKLLRSGLREALVQILKKIGGTELAKRLTERAMMRLLVPGISIPISAAANYAFTKKFLKVANGQMVRRGAALQPLIRLCALAPEVEREVAIKALITVMEAPRRDAGWDENQLQVLRMTQSFVNLSDEQVRELDLWFDRQPSDIRPLICDLAGPARDALSDFLAVAAALGVKGNDEAYSKAILDVTGADSAVTDRIGALRTGFKAA